MFTRKSHAPARWKARHAMPRKNKVLQIGEKAPDFDLPDAVGGGRVTQDDMLGRPFVLVFLRGTW